MKRTVAISSVFSLVLVLGFSVLLHGQKAGTAKAPQQPQIPLKVTFYAVDDNGAYTRMHGHSSAGTVDVQYVDSNSGNVSAYLQRTDGQLWFHVDSTSDSHIDFDFVDQIAPGIDWPPAFEGHQDSVRITTIGASQKPNFATLPAGLSAIPLTVQFWSGGDIYAWNVRYDDPTEAWVNPPSTVDVDVQRDGLGNNVKWTLTPRDLPQYIPVFAGARLDKYHNEKSLKGDQGYYDYGTWVMPFKIVLERK